MDVDFVGKHGKTAESLTQKLQVNGKRLCYNDSESKR